MLLDLFEHWALHTQEIEGVNSVLKYTTTLAPHIGFPLLSSRISIKKLLHYYGAVTDREARRRLLQELENFYDIGADT